MLVLCCVARVSVPTNMLFSGAFAVCPVCLVYFLCLSDALPMCFMWSLCFLRARSLQFYAFAMLGLLIARAFFMRFLCVCCGFLMVPASCARACVCVCVCSFCAYHFYCVCVCYFLVIVSSFAGLRCFSYAFLIASLCCSYVFVPMLLLCYSDVCFRFDFCIYTNCSYELCMPSNAFHTIFLCVPSCFSHAFPIRFFDVSFLFSSVCVCVCSYVSPMWLLRLSYVFQCGYCVFYSF